MDYFKDLISIFFPKRCLHCKVIIPNHIEFVCENCSSQLQETPFFEITSNPIQQLFTNIPTVNHVAALYYYQKEQTIQTMLKQLKYKGLESFGTHSALIVIEKLKRTTSFNNINYIIPVPLHSKKEKKRGYNQVSLFGKTLANYMQCDFLVDGITKISDSTSQTSKNRKERFDSVQNLFVANTKYNFENSTILLVDDVLTTGATLTACSACFKKHKNIQINIITIACVI